MQNPLSQTIVALDSNAGLLALHSALEASGQTIPNLLHIPMRDRGGMGQGAFADLRSEARGIALRLSRAGVSRLLLVCNTLSALLAPLGAQSLNSSGCSILGVLAPTVQAIRESCWFNNDPVLIVGSAALGQSAVYQESLRALGHRSVFQTGTDVIRDIAHGRTKGIPERLAEMIQGHRRHSGLAAAVLSCTHFHQFAEPLRRLLPDLSIIDSGEAFLTDKKLRSLMKPRPPGETSSMTVLMPPGQCPINFQRLIHDLRPGTSMRFLPTGIYP